MNNLKIYQANKLPYFSIVNNPWHLSAIKSYIISSSLCKKKWKLPVCLDLETQIEADFIQLLSDNFFIFLLVNGMLVNYVMFWYLCLCGTHKKFPSIHR